MRDLVVLFGKPGSGKDTMADYLEDKHNYHVIRGDEHLPLDYVATLKLGIPTTEEQRDRTADIHIRLTQEALLEHERVALCFAFSANKHRILYKEAFPFSRFVLIQTEVEVLRERLEESPRVGHILTTEATMKKQNPIDPPTIPHLVLENNNNLQVSQERLRQTLGLLHPTREFEVRREVAAFYR